MTGTTESAAAPPRAGRREWLGLAVLALPTLLLALDISVLHLAAPHLSADLGASSNQLLWILDIYGFMIAGFLVTMGTLGDRIGRRKLLLIGATAFGAASVVAAYASSPELLIAARALLGVAGATLMPSTLALISNMFKDPKQRSLAIGVWIICFSAGAAVGPVLGGAMLEWFWWGSVFLLGVPVMVVLLIAAPLLLPEYRDREAGRLDLVSVVLSLVAMIPVIYGLKELAKDGLAVLPLISLMFGAAMGLIFVRRQLTLPTPLVEIQLFRNRAFTSALTLMLAAAFASSGVMLFFIQSLQMVQGMSSLRAGLWMIPMTAGMVLGSVLAPILARHFPPGRVVSLGLLLAAVGYLFMSTNASSLGVTLTGLLIASVGMSPAMVLGTDLVLGSAPPEKAGSASSMSETAGELGMAMGIAVLGTLGAAVYRSQMSGGDWGGLPPEAAATAEDGMPGALTVVEGLSEDGAGLLASARDAFSQGMAVTTVVSGLLLALFAVVAARGLRHVRPIGEESATSGGGDGAAETVLGDASPPAGENALSSTGR